MVVVLRCALPYMHGCCIMVCLALQAWLLYYGVPCLTGMVVVLRSALPYIHGCCITVCLALEAWLLYYGVPCLTGILPDIYLQHFTKLSEATYILLGDCVTVQALCRANPFLDEFYSEFEALYGDGSCGLNVHSGGPHLGFYVAEWGPLWTWSCFAFEDSNAKLLQAVHGTGNVVNQAIRFKQAQAVIHKHGYSKLTNKP